MWHETTTEGEIFRGQLSFPLYYKAESQVSTTHNKLIGPSYQLSLSRKMLQHAAAWVWI